MRIGTGYDVHRLGEGLPLWIGGERIDLLLSELMPEEELSVEVRLVHGVEVSNDKLLHAGAHKQHGDIRAKSARACDAGLRRFKDPPFPLCQIRVCAHVILPPRCETH